MRTELANVARVSACGLALLLAACTQEPYTVSGWIFPECDSGQVVTVNPGANPACLTVVAAIPECGTGTALTSDGVSLSCASCQLACVDLGMDDMSLADMTAADMTPPVDMTMPPMWAQRAYIKASNADAVDHFGTGVAIDGDTIVVGAPHEASAQLGITNGAGAASADDTASLAGAAYVYRRTANMWAQEAYLKASNTAAGDTFGNSVAISGDTIVVGAEGRATSTGAAYVFKRTGATWAEQAILTAANAAVDDQFGFKVAISGDTIAVGAIGEDSNQITITNGATASADNSAARAGAVYVYTRTGATWSQQAYIKAANAEMSDEFGVSVALSGDTLVVGATGEDSNQATITNGATASADNSISALGAVYVYKRTGGSWQQEAYLKPPNGELLDQFGGAVAISGDTIAVGARNESSNQTTITNGATASANNDEPGAGAVYVYSRTGVTWSQQAYVKAANAGTADEFGGSVALLGDTLVVGALGESSNQITITNGTTASADDTVQSAGAAYVYRRTGATWAPEAYLKAPNPGIFDRYGFGVSVTEVAGKRIVAVGADRENSNQTTITNGATITDNDDAAQAGAVYVVGD